MAIRKRERIFALFFAVLFLVTSSALAIAVIVSNIQSKKSDGASSQQTTKVTKGNTMLKGTKLANFTPVASVTQLQASDTKEGDGQVVKTGDTINFDYTGALAKDGTIFESSIDSGQAITYPLTSLIKGWQDGIPGMKVGGTRRLLIPAAQAYGAQAQPGIPANSDLVFDITVHSVK